MNKTVVYTCLFGNYDSFKDPEFVDSNIDYICFSNSLKQKDFSVWKIVSLTGPEYEKYDNIILSRLPKLRPHLFLEDYKYSLYIDSNIDILDSYITDRILDLNRDKDTLISLVKHPLRDCIYDEAQVIKKTGLSIYKSVNQNIDILDTFGFEKNKGLFENNLIYRKHTQKKIQDLSDLWLTIFLKYAKRDQLSLVFLMDYYKISPGLLLPGNKSVRNTSHFRYKSHKKNQILSLRRKYLKIVNFLLDNE